MVLGCILSFQGAESTRLSREPRPRPRRRGLHHSCTSPGSRTGNCPVHSFKPARFPSTRPSPPSTHSLRSFPPRHSLPVDVPIPAGSTVRLAVSPPGPSEPRLTLARELRTTNNIYPRKSVPPCQQCSESSPSLTRTQPSRHDLPSSAILPEEEDPLAAPPPSSDSSPATNVRRAEHRARRPPRDAARGQLGAGVSRGQVGVGTGGRAGTAQAAGQGQQGQGR